MVYRLSSARSGCVAAFVLAGGLVFSGIASANDVAVNFLRTALKNERNVAAGTIDGILAVQRGVEVITPEALGQLVYVMCLGKIAADGIQQVDRLEILDKTGRSQWTIRNLAGLCAKSPSPNPSDPEVAEFISKN